MANYYKRNTRKRSETFIVTLGLKHHIADEKLQHRSLQWWS